MINIPPYNNTLISCTDDIPCPGNSQCVYQNQSSDTSDGICGCGANWGNGGIYCDEFGATAYYKIIFHSFLCILLSIIIILVFVDLMKLRKQKKLNNLNVKATALVECILGSISALLFHAFSILVVLKPNDLILIDDASLGFWKGSKYVMYLNVTAVILSFFQVASILNIGALWLEVAIASKKFQKLNNPQISKNYIIFVAVIDIIMVITVIVTFTYSATLAGVTIAPIYVLIAIGYGYSAHALSKVIKEQANSGSDCGEDIDTSSSLSVKGLGRKYREAKMKESLRRIRLCAAAIVLAIFMTIISLALNFIIGNKARKVYISPNIVSLPAFVISVAFIGQAAMFFTIYWYIHDSIKDDEFKLESKIPTAEVAIGIPSPRSSSNLALSP